VFKPSQKPSADTTVKSGVTQPAGDRTAIVVSGDRYVVVDDDFAELVDLLGVDDDPTAKELFEAIMTELQDGQDAKARLEEIRERIGPMLDQ
jgi:hypothetical protein